MNSVVSKSIVVAGVLAFCGLSFADKRSGVWTYEWSVPYALEREVEFWWTDFGGGHSDIQFEFEYGVDGHYVVAPYLLIERDGNDYRTVGWKLEQRYAFGEFEPERILPSAYLELKKKGDEPYELEAKAIGTYTFNTGVSISGNLVVERKMESGAPVEWGYAAMVSQKFGERSVALEAFGSFTDGTLHLGPTLGMTMQGGEAFLAGYAFNTDGGPGRLRFLLRKEF